MAGAALFARAAARLLVAVTAWTDTPPMSRRVAKSGLGKGALWVLGLALVGGAIGLGIWRGRHLPSWASHLAAGSALGALVGASYAFAGGHRFAWKKVDLHIPLLGSAELEAEKTEGRHFALDPSQRAVGWKIYVELVGRVALQPVDEGTGTLRGALQSFYDLLQKLRVYLAEVPPQAPPPSTDRDPIYTLETLTIWIMDEARQLLATWHHRLVQHEGAPTPGKLPAPDDTFEGKAECEAAIAALQKRLRVYATELARLLEVPGPDLLRPPTGKKSAPAKSAEAPPSKSSAVPPAPGAPAT